MFNDLILALTIISGTPHAADQALVTPNRPIASTAPSCVAGPVRARLRKSDRLSQVASSSIVGRDINRGFADENAQAD